MTNIDTMISKFVAMEDNIKKFKDFYKIQFSKNWAEFFEFYESL